MLGHRCGDAITAETDSGSTESTPNRPRDRDRGQAGGRDRPQQHRGDPRGRPAAGSERHRRGRPLAGAPALIREADIVVAACGIAEYVQGAWLKPGAVVIDVGINAVDDASKKRGYRLVGDVDFASCAAAASHLTPVPGGVGPMTIAMLLRNCVDGAARAGAQPWTIDPMPPSRASRSPLVPPTRASPYMPKEPVGLPEAARCGARVPAVLPRRQSLNAPPRPPPARREPRERNDA